ncbi:MAG TPA: hypothetical protein DDW76_06675 [Cyanobacteria bacterium UBA11369]|nr:hypothetical protein [Cyanobacteria bacterium UBA11371]HBE32489.1 hypothetical protein [Cyanobacteria bacterium UBA11368]HBE48485.1 hypothetical protein [Cyanobacteria bacterium UBA11369]
MAEKDVYPISDLRERYGLSSRQTVYDRMKALNIEPVVRGKISAEQLKQMDKLDEHLKKGGTLSNFGVETSQNQSDASLIVAELTKLVEAIAPTPNPPEPLQALEELEKAALKGWLLTTEQVQQLLGVKPKVKGSDRTFTRGSFSFVKSGKIGSQTAWRVLKVSAGES